MQLLAEDVESRLEALLRTFIQEEKLRQEARYNSLMGKRSASLSALNSDYTDAASPELSNADYSVSPISRSLYGQQLNRPGGSPIANKSTGFGGYVKPQQHRMQQSYQLHNSQNVNTPQQQKPTAIKTSHRLDSSPGRPSSAQSSPSNSKVVVTRTRSPSPTGRQPQANLFPVNRNNLFGQHQRAEQQNKATSTTATGSKPTSYLNLHQRSQSPSKDGGQAAASKSSQPQSSQLVSSGSSSNKQPASSQFLGHSSSHRLYAPNQIKFYDPFSTSSSQFGRSKDDSHIRRVVVYNLKDAASASEKKPVIIEQQQGLKSMNGTLNNGFANVTSGEKAETADNQAIRLRSAKTRANSPNRVGILNGSSSGNMSTTSGVGAVGAAQHSASSAGKQATNSLATGRLALNSAANTASGSKASSNSGSSSLNSNTNSLAAGKKLSSSTGPKVTTTTTSAASSRLAAGHENSFQQFKDHNNNLDSQQSGVGVGSAAQLNTERKVVRKVIVKELDGGPRSESSVNSSGGSGSSKPTHSSTYQQQQQRLSPISNGDLTSVPAMATLNSPPPMTNSHHPVSSLDALLSERDRILNNRDQYKQLRSNVLASDANNNYLLSSKNNNKFNTTHSELSAQSAGLTSGTTAAGLPSSAGLVGNRAALGHQSANTTTANRNLPLSSSAASAKRKPLVDRYSPFSIVSDVRQRFEETHKNGMNDALNDPSPSRFHSLDDYNLETNADPLDSSDELLFNELACDQSDEEIVDSSMVLIRSKLSRLLSANGHNVNLTALPNSAILSLLNHLSKNKQTENEPLTLPLPACLAELNRLDELPLNTSHNTPFSHASPNCAPLAPSIASINSMRPPLVITSLPADCMN